MYYIGMQFKSNSKITFNSTKTQYQENKENSLFLQDKAKIQSYVTEVKSWSGPMLK